MVLFDPAIVPVLSRITIYPIKALNGFSLEQVDVNPSGALHGDRCIAMLDAGNAFINGKRYPQVNQIQARYSVDQRRVFLSLCGLEGEEQFELQADNCLLREWLSDALGMRVRLDSNHSHGFPDSSSAAGPTLISRASLHQLGRWFPHLESDSLARRFRANLEIDAVPAFWEDGLVLEGAAPFRIGALSFTPVKLCDRCQVPSQDPDTGEVDNKFQSRLMRARAALLPAGVNPYTLSVKTRLTQEGEGGSLQLGMVLSRDDG